MRYICPLCGYVYDPDEGDDSAGVPSGAAFDELPETWECPLCGAEKSEFTRM